MRSPLAFLFGAALLLSGCGGGSGGGGGTGPAAPVTVVLTSTPALDGHVYASGTVATTDDIAVGDFMLGTGVRGFVSFDLAGIPAGAEIHSAKLTLFRYTAYGNPYVNLGALLVDQAAYGNALDAGAYGRTFPVNQGIGVLVGSFGPQSVPVTDAVQNAVDNGDPQAQFRLRFFVEADSDGVSDGVTFRSADTATTPAEMPTLEVTYFP